MGLLILPGEVEEYEVDAEEEEGGGDAKQRRVGALIVGDEASARPWMLIMGWIMNPCWCRSCRGAW